MWYSESHSTSLRLWVSHSKVFSWSFWESSPNRFYSSTYLMLASLNLLLRSWTLCWSSWFFCDDDVISNWRHFSMSSIRRSYSWRLMTCCSRVYLWSMNLTCRSLSDLWSILYYIWSYWFLFDNIYYHFYLISSIWFLWSIILFSLWVSSSCCYSRSSILSLSFSLHNLMKSASWFSLSTLCWANLRFVIPNSIIAVSSCLDNTTDINKKIPWVEFVDGSHLPWTYSSMFLRLFSSSLWRYRPNIIYLTLMLLLSSYSDFFRVGDTFEARDLRY